MGIQLVGTDGSQQIIDRIFNFDVLADQQLGLGADSLFLHLDKVVEGNRLTIIGQTHKHNLGDGLQVVLNTIFDDIVDADDQLLQLVESGVNMMQVAIDVHGSPSQGDHTGSQLVLQIFQMGRQQRLSDGSDLVVDTIILLEDVQQLVIVHLELLFLQEDNLGTFWDFNSSQSIQALGLTNELHDFHVKVDIQLSVLGMSNNQSGLKTGLGFLDLVTPSLQEQVLESCQRDGDLVVRTNESSGIVLRGNDVREVLHRSRHLLQQMSGPLNITSHRWHISLNGRVLILAGVFVLNRLNLISILLENQRVLVGQIILQAFTNQDVLEFLQQHQGIF
mmetsp:Transcript_40210/g.45990  ORF Transcript_40210/g.45990 Transcript_40210/m.45990 type:complete len:334 (-) Transcript_40210:699-1700(-)